MNDTIRINYRGLPLKQCSVDRKNSRQKFECWLDDGTIISPTNGVTSPAYDGARILIAMGCDPAAMMTTKASTTEHDSWMPQAIAKFAKLTISEPDEGAIRVNVYRNDEGAQRCEAP